MPSSGPQWLIPGYDLTPAPHAAAHARCASDGHSTSSSPMTKSTSAPAGAEILAQASYRSLELWLLSCCSTRPDSLRHREQAQRWTSGVESHSALAVLSSDDPSQCSTLPAFSASLNLVDGCHGGGITELTSTVAGRQGR